jgi:hypothetical protein
MSALLKPAAATFDPKRTLSQELEDPGLARGSNSPNSPFQKQIIISGDQIIDDCET